MDTKTKGIFATTLALFLITGILAGVILDRTVLTPRATAPKAYADNTQQDHRPPPPRGGEGNAFDPMDRIAEKMTAELSLDQKQQHELDAILASYKTDFETIRRDIKKQFDALDMELSEKTMKILSKDQKVMFEKKFVRWPKPMQHPGDRQGPPREALNACQGKQLGAACSFSHENRDITGLCATGARGETLCIPPMGHPGPPEN